jgi:hypothetical protein
MLARWTESTPQWGGDKLNLHLTSIDTCRQPRNFSRTTARALPQISENESRYLVYALTGRIRCHLFFAANDHVLASWIQ